jgi:hypothetical protein
MTDREMDTAIDRAVRDLMDVDTDAAFRARVTARLHRPVRRAWAPRLAAGAVAMLAIAVALVWLRAPQPPTKTESSAARTQGAVPAQTPRIATSNSKAPVSAPMTRAAKSTRRMAAPSIPRGTMVAAVTELPFTSIAPLTPIEPISVQPIASPPITPSEIVVAPLSPIAEVEISPLEPRPARD